MSNISCEIIEDLLPLYCDGVCSEDSKKMILAHVQTCETCREELRVLDLPIDIPAPAAEVEAAAAASTAWKKNKRKAFRMGLLVAVLLFVTAMALFLGSHYLCTTTSDDFDGLRQQLEALCEVSLTDVRSVVQKGDYLAVSGRDGNGLWYLGVFARDIVFSDRWGISGSLNGVKAGNLANWNYQTPEGDTILVCFGAELGEDICGYTFINSGVTYTCSVDDSTVLDFFFIPDAYDSRTRLEPLYAP